MIKSSRRNLFSQMAATGVMVLVFAVGNMQAATIIKQDNSTNLNLGASWVGGVPAGGEDLATWNAAYSSRTYSMGSDLAWSGMAVTADPTGTLTINAGYKLTLGTNGIQVGSFARELRINAAIQLATNQAWTMSSSTLTLTGIVDTAGYTLTLDGGGIKLFNSAITGGGPLVLAKYYTRLGNGAVATASDIFVNNGAVLDFIGAPAVGGAARAANVTISGAGGDNTRARLLSTGASGADTLDIISGAVTINAGQAIVTATPHATRYLHLNAGSYVRNQGSTVLFRGTDLGVSTIASATVGDANISFTAAPALVGGGGAPGTTTVSIIHGAIGDIIAISNGTALVTYDAGKGVRLLDTGSEFTTGIASGQTQLDNVRYANTSGSGMQTYALTQDSTINSLSFDVTGAGSSSGITITGDTLDRRVTLNSGMIFARQVVTTPVASDSMIMTNLTLDLGGKEGVFLCDTRGINNGNTPAPLYIFAVIANDGGNGVTIGSPGNNGEIFFAGSATNTYTGPTILNSGYLRLMKGSSVNTNIGIPGNLIINGGTLMKNGESIPDTADVTINGGALYHDSTTSSGNNGHQETIRNLIMNGGYISYNGKNSRFYIKGDAEIGAQDLGSNTGGDVSVNGTASLKGGRVLVSISDSTNSYNALFTLNQVVVSNTAQTAYAPIVLKAHTNYWGGLLTITGDVTFVGNSINTNDVTIESESAGLAQQGIIALNGTRTFNIGNGAAENDLAVKSPIAITNGTSPGGITKTGAGTLSLGGTNTYTGPTTVSAGTLHLAGSLASAATVGTNAVLAGSGILAAAGTGLTVESGGSVAPGTTNTIGILTVNGNVQFNDGARMRINVDGANADRLSVSGNVTGTGTVQINVSRTDTLPALPLLIMTAAHIDPAFAVQSVPGLGAVLKNNDTELWLDLSRKGTLMLFR